MTQWGSALGAAVLLLAGWMWAQRLGIKTSVLGQFLIGPELKLKLALPGGLLVLGLTITVLLSNLILAAVRRWLNLTGAKLRGESTGAAQPAAERVGNWLIFCMVMLAFDIASRLSILPLLAVAREFFSPGLPASWLVLLEGAVWPLIAALLLGLMQSVALLWALLYSRRFALSAAQVMDGLLS